MNETTVKTKVAWHVSEPDEDRAWIVFADGEDDARSYGAWELDTECEYVEVKRSPDHDQYSALGYVPPEVMISEGWGLYCDECEHVVDSDNEHEREYPDDYEGDEEYYYPDPVFEGRRVFCCQECRDQWHSDRAILKQRQEEAKAHILSKFPKAENINIWGGHPKYDVYASFRFGGRYPADWNSSNPDSVMISQIDQDVFREWKDLQ